jgi:hypothetical protein
MELKPPVKNILNAMWKILIVDDDEDDFLILHDMLKEAKGRKTESHWAATYVAGEKELARNPYDAVFVDYVWVCIRGSSSSGQRMIWDMFATVEKPYPGRSQPVIQAG